MCSLEQGEPGGSWGARALALHRCAHAELARMLLPPQAAMGYRQRSVARAQLRRFYPTPLCCSPPTSCVPCTIPLAPALPPPPPVLPTIRPQGQPVSNIVVTARECARAIAEDRLEHASGGRICRAITQVRPAAQACTLTNPTRGPSSTFRVIKPFSVGAKLLGRGRAGCRSPGAGAACPVCCLFVGQLWR